MARASQWLHWRFDRAILCLSLSLDNDLMTSPPSERRTKATRRPFRTGHLTASEVVFQPALKDSGGGAPFPPCIEYYGIPLNRGRMLCGCVYTRTGIVRVGP